MAASDFVNSIIVFYFDQLQYNKCPSKPVMLRYYVMLSFFFLTEKSEFHETCFLEQDQIRGFIRNDKV